MPREELAEQERLDDAAIDDFDDAMSKGYTPEEYLAEAREQYQDALNDPEYLAASAKEQDERDARFIAKDRCEARNERRREKRKQIKTTCQG